MNRPYAPAIGCAPAGFAAGYPGYPYAGGYPGFYGGAALAPVSYDIVGADPAPAPQQSFLDKAKEFGQKETFGIKNQNLALGAAALGVITYGAFHGWFGGGRRR